MLILHAARALSKVARASWTSGVSGPWGLTRRQRASDRRGSSHRRVAARLKSMQTSLHRPPSARMGYSETPHHTIRTLVIADSRFRYLLEV